MTPFGGAPRLVALVALVACSKERSVPVSENVDPTGPTFVAAVERFVAAGRTPDAFRELAHVADLTSHMNRDGRDEVERRVVVLALYPVELVQTLPATAQADALALTVWPTLLAEPFNAVQTTATQGDAIFPAIGEDAQAYLKRLCGGPLADECGRVVPEHRAAAVAALAVRRAVARTRTAVAACDTCRSDPGWHEAVRSWEQLERVTTHAFVELGGSAAVAAPPTSDLMLP